MIFIEDLKGHGKIFFLVGKEYTVGRKAKPRGFQDFSPSPWTMPWLCSRMPLPPSIDCDVLISGDQSISRKHAVLKVVHPENNLNDSAKPATLILIDSSKFGTVVNGTKIPNGESRSLSQNDTISFGAQGTNSWKVHCTPLVAACSGISGAEKKELKILVHKLGGHLLSDWQRECSMLVMKQLNVTAKVVSALVSCKPIVTPEYLDQTKRVIMEKGDSLPEPINYLPPVVEKAIGQDSSVFAVNEERLSLLKGKTFVFLSQKQHKRLHTGIELAGGSTRLIQGDGDLLNNKQLLFHPQTCVMQSEAADNTQAPQETLMRIDKLLKSKGLRLIAESELGLAVLYVSTKLYCNPSVSQAGVTLISSVRDSQAPAGSNQKVLALETQPKESQQCQTPDRGAKRNEISVMGRVPSTPEHSRSSETTTNETVTVKKEIISPKAPASRLKDVEKTHDLSNVENLERNLKKEKNMKSDVNNSNTVSATLKEQQSFDSVAEDSGKRKRGTAPTFEEVTFPSLTQDFTFTEVSRAKRIKTEAGLDDETKVKTLEPRTLDGERDTTQEANLPEGVQIKTEPEDLQSQSQDQSQDSEGDSQLWRRNKKKRRHLLQKDAEDESALNSHDAPATSNSDFISNAPSIPAGDVPKGFLSKSKPPKLAVKQEPEDTAIPSKVIVVREVSCVKRSKPMGTSEERVRNGKPVKNFKKFRKAGYAGQSLLPRIIGGSDLIVHHNQLSQESQEFFMPDIGGNSDIDRADALADELFSVGSKQTLLPRGRKR